MAAQLMTKEKKIAHQKPAIVTALLKKKQNKTILAITWTRISVYIQIRS